MSRLALLMLALALVGCAAPTQEDTPAADLHPPPTEPAPTVEPPPVELRIDESLPPEYEAAVLEGLEKWAAAGFEVPPVSVVPFEEANVLASDDCLEVDTLAAGCAWPGSHVHFVPETIESDLWLTREFVALHELGHFLGITQHLPDGNVMQEGVTHPMPPPELAPADIQALKDAPPIW